MLTPLKHLLWSSQHILVRPNITTNLVNANAASHVQVLKHCLELWSLASQPVSTTSRHESQGNKHGPYDWYDFKTTDTPLALQLNIEQALWGAMVSRDAKFFRNNR